MAKTSVEIDRDILDAAAAILGTTTLRETIDASLHEVVNAQRRLELVAMLGEEGRFDFDAAERLGRRRVGARVRYLVDTSVPQPADQAPGRHRVLTLAAAGNVAVCAPVAFELGYLPATARTTAALMERLAAFPQSRSPKETTGGRWRSAELCARGRHRALSLVDALVAAASRAHRHRAPLRRGLRAGRRGHRPAAGLGRRAGPRRLR